MKKRHFMQKIVCLLTATLVGCCSPTTAPAPVVAQLVLRLKAKSRTVRVDAPPNVTATIENVGKTSAVLVLPGDGSREGWRTPIVKWSILSEQSFHTKHTPPPQERQFRKCGNMDGIDYSSLVILRPGERRQVGSMSIYDGAGSPGKYRVVYYYHNDPQREWGGPGSITSDLLEQLRQSTPCQLKSNEIILTVKK